MRIAFGVAAGLAFVWLALLWTVRQPSFSSPKASVSSRERQGASASRLQGDVESLCAIDHRDADHPDQLRLAASYIERELRATGARVEIQAFDGRIPSGTASFTNVIASFGDVGSKEPRLVVGAHYDAFGLFGENPGADDNASGTAGLIELARLLGASDFDPPVTVELVAYANEEPPFFASPSMGSSVHADSLEEEALPVLGMISLEMIGYFTERQPWPNWLYASLYPNDGGFIGVVGRFEDRHLAKRVRGAFRDRALIDAYTFTPPSWVPGTDASDHRSYWDRGHNAVMISDTSFLRNPNYHTPNDRPETLDYEKMADVVDGVLAAVIELSESGSLVERPGAI